MEGEYYKIPESVDEYIRMAKDVNGKHLIEQLQKVLPQGSRLLEVGSGPGTDWKIMSEFYTVIGSDNSPEFLKRLQAAHPEGEFILLDAVTLETELEVDGIYSNKVLHHLRDDELKNSIQRQAEVLKPGGVICHSFWKGESLEVFKGMVVNCHTREGLEELFGEQFEILLLEEYAEFEEGDSLLMIGRRR